MKKPKFTLLLLLFATSSLTFSQNVGIGLTNPDASALLDLNPPNNDKGLLIPRLDSTQRNDIPNPAESLLIFNTDSQCYEGYSTVKSQWFPVGCLKNAPTTPPFVCNEELTDTRDNNTYKTVQIGNQCWMAENLAYLPDVVHNNAQFQTQGNNSQPGYGVYNYNGSDVTTAKSQADYTTYGVLYNWYAVVDTDNPACPTGWHVPSDAEWKEMEIYLGMDPANAEATSWRNTGNVGQQLKTSIWGGTNTSGFTALPGGFRGSNGTFYSLDTYGYWWAASESADGTRGSARSLSGSSGNNGINRFWNLKPDGMSLRCVLD